MREIWNVDDVAAYLKRSPGAIRNLTLRRAIPYRKVAGRLVFIRDEIEKWIESAPGLRLKDLDR